MMCLIVSAILDIKFPEDYPNVPPILNVEPLTGIGAHEASDFSNRASELVCFDKNREENDMYSHLFCRPKKMLEWK